MGQQVDKEGREGTTEEGKEGDKVKECSETTGPLFLLKELPRHSAPMGGLQVPLHKGGVLTKLGSLDPPRLLLVRATHRNHVSGLFRSVV